MDARPSDAIALALRFQAPIFVDERVIEKSSAGTISGEALDESEDVVDEVIEIRFEEGFLRVELPPNMIKNLAARVTLCKEGKLREVSSPHINGTWSFHRQAEAFIKNIREKEKSVASASDSIEDIRLIEDIWHCELSRPKGH